MVTAPQPLGPSAGPAICACPVLLDLTPALAALLEERRPALAFLLKGASQASSAGKPNSWLSAGACRGVSQPLLA